MTQPPIHEPYRHFDLAEFDSPGSPGTGRYMQPEFLQRLDTAREIAKRPFRITPGGGFRTVDYNNALMKRNKNASPTSSHLYGWAADIATSNSVIRYAVINALLLAGFNRLGLGHSYIHVDADPNKPGGLVWTY